MENKGVKYSRFILGLYLILLAFTVFTPKTSAFGGHRSGIFYLISSTFQPFHNNQITLWVGNFLLLAPLGILLLHVSSWSLTRISLTLFTTTTTIELIQYLVPTRVPDIKTILINGIGGTLTTLLYDRLISHKIKSGS